MLLVEDIRRFVADRASRGPCFRTLTACPLCGSERLRRLFSKWGFDHLECGECDLVFVAQEPTAEFLDDFNENLEYYRATLRLVEKPRLEHGHSFNFRMDVDDWCRFIVDEVLRWQSSGRWLDVGGSTGRLLRYVNRHAPRFETLLCESNTMACELAKKYCSVKACSWEELDGRSESFDVITAIAVFEHVPSSLDFLKRTSRLLKPGGVLYMTMPRMGPLARHISKETLYDVAPPGHLRFFSRKSLQRLEKEAAGALRLKVLRQSHGKTFHVGQWFRPEWYHLIDLLPEREGDSPRRTLLGSPTTPLQRTEYRLLAILDGWLSPLSTRIDGQRVLHCLWQKPRE